MKIWPRRVLIFAMLVFLSGCASLPGKVLKETVLPPRVAIEIQPHPVCSLKVEARDLDDDGKPDMVVIVPDEECHKEFIRRMGSPPSQPALPTRLPARAGEEKAAIP